MLVILFVRLHFVGTHYLSVVGSMRLYTTMIASYDFPYVRTIAVRIRFVAPLFVEWMCLAAEIELMI
jgi:hypothetical protein